MRSEVCLRALSRQVDDEVVVVLLVVETDNAIVRREAKGHVDRAWELADDRDVEADVSARRVCHPLLRRRGTLPITHLNDGAMFSAPNQNLLKFLIFSPTFPLSLFKIALSPITGNTPGFFREGMDHSPFRF